MTRAGDSLGRDQARLWNAWGSFYTTACTSLSFLPPGFIHSYCHHVQGRHLTCRNTCISGENQENHHLLTLCLFLDGHTVWWGQCRLWNVARLICLWQISDGWTTEPERRKVPSADALTCWEWPSTAQLRANSVKPQATSLSPAPSSGAADRLLTTFVTLLVLVQAVVYACVNHVWFIRMLGA